MRKYIIIIISIILGFVTIAIISNLILKNRRSAVDNFNNETIKEAINFDIINVDLEKIDLNVYSIKDCENIVKDVINRYNNNEYNQYNSSDIQSKINRLKELVEVKKYYEEVSKCVNHIKKNATFEEQKELYYKTDEDIILTLCDTKKDWSLLKISNELYYKLKKSNGILENNNITSYYVDNEPPYKVQRVKLIYESGKQKVELIISKETDYVYADENSYGSEIISNFIIEDTINLTDNHGNEIDTRKVFINESIKRNFEELCKDGDERSEMDYPDGEHYGYYGDDVAVSDNFRNKYPYFLDIFIHYSPLEYNKITLKDLEIDNQIATFEVDSILECKIRTYDVKYMLDNKMYLDDVEVKLLEENSYAGNKNERTNKILYKNSNWDKLELTVSFLNKYSNDIGVVPDIDKINVDVKVKEVYLTANDYYNYIYEYKTIDNVYLYYYVNFVCDKNGYIDDINFDRLDYDSSMTLEEVRDAYIRDYVEKK